MDESDFPLKQDEQPTLASAVVHESMVRVRPFEGTSGSTCVNGMGSYSLDQCGGTLSELEPPSPNLWRCERTCSAAEELRNEKNDMLVFPSNESVQRSRRGLWPHLYQLAGGSKLTVSQGVSLLEGKDKLMVSIRENPERDDANGWHFKHLNSKLIDETARKSIKKLDGQNSEKALLPQDARLKILSSSSFSQFFGKKTPKGKGIMDAHLGDKAQTENGGTLQFYGILSSTLALTSSAEMQLSERCKRDIDYDSKSVGVTLRKWLNPGNHVNNKAERLNIFFQIAELVSLAHSQGAALEQLCPSYFILSPSNKVKYIGSSTCKNMDVSMLKTTCKKRPAEAEFQTLCTSKVKQQKLSTHMNSRNNLYSATSVISTRTASLQDSNHRAGFSSSSDSSEHKVLNTLHSQSRVDKCLAAGLLLEQKWYACPEDIDGNVCKLSSNIYSLGVLFFELLCSFDSVEAHSAAMFDMSQRILPPSFLSESPTEVGFCLWLIHPDSSSRPTMREILLSDLFSVYREPQSSDKLTVLGNDDKLGQLEPLLDFLISSEEKKQAHAVKLIEEINCIEADIKGLEEKALSTASQIHVKRDCTLQDFIKSVTRSGRTEARLISDMSQLERVYFSMRAQSTASAAVARSDKELLRTRESSSQVQKQNEMVGMDQKPTGGLDGFFDGLCKFSCFSKFKLCGTLRNGDLLNSSNVICSLSFDRDEEFIAVAGASKKIKIFEFSALLNDAIDIHYPVIEMGNKSKLSCLSWNSYIQSYLASTDYDGAVQVWDASTGQGLSQHLEHQKRAWSVDFSRVDPTKFATGSDDCSVKLWSTNERRSTCTIWSPANVCCLQYSPYSSHLLAFGSADHKIYGYDLRYTRIPWCLLAGHEKTVSFVKFVDSETLVSASTDNTLKLWDLSKTSLSGISSDVCRLTFTGHTNKKHFVGLSAHDGYIACGSESNEVFTYYRSLPMPVTSYKFSRIDPASQHDAGDDGGAFVSSVSWRSKSNMVLAANSGGSIRLLQLV